MDGASDSKAKAILRRHVGLVRYNMPNNVIDVIDVLQMQQLVCFVLKALD